MCRKILELSHQEAKAFFLESKSYCSLNLPCYFDFSDLLKKLSSCIGEFSTSTFKLLTFKFNEKLCDSVTQSGNLSDIWKINWLKQSDSKTQDIEVIFRETKIINQYEFDKLDDKIQHSEINLFNNDY